MDDVAGGRALASTDHGVSLVELLVAMLVIAVAFSAMLSVLWTSLRTTVRVEREHAAMAIAVGAVEEMRDLHWDALVLPAVQLTRGGPEARRWQARVDEAQLDGRPLALTRTVRGPGASLLPTSTVATETGDVHLDSYVTWVDRTGDDVVETKRIVAVASWTGLDGVPREVTFEAERVRRGDEGPSARSTAALTRVSVSPTPVAALSRGGLAVPVTVRADANTGLASLVALVTWTEPSGDVTVRLPMRLVDPAHGIGYTAGTVAWAGEHPSGATSLPTGAYTVAVVGRTVAGDRVATTASFDVVDELAAPSVVDVRALGGACVAATTWSLGGASTIRVTVDDLAHAGEDVAGALVTVEFPRWTNVTTPPGAPDGHVAYSAELLVARGSSSTWTVTVGDGDGLRVPPDVPLTLLVDAIRASDGAAAAGTVRIPGFPAC